MTYTTVTSLAKNGKKEFEGAAYKTVLSNNRPVGMLLSREMFEAMEENGILLQVQEELYELHDRETRDLIERSRTRKLTNSISLSDFRSKYAI